MASLPTRQTVQTVQTQRCNWVSYCYGRIQFMAVRLVILIASNDITAKRDVLRISYSYSYKKHSHRTLCFVRRIVPSIQRFSQTGPWSASESSVNIVLFANITTKSIYFKAHATLFYHQSLKHMTNVELSNIE